MKRDTRQDILNTAQALFREKGYNAVSVGEIAAALGISKGNLTYYFKRKEEIVEALLESANPTFPQDPPQTLVQLDACLRDMEQARENNAFYFRSHTQLGQLSEKIRAKQREVYRRHSCSARVWPTWPPKACSAGKPFPGSTFGWWTRCSSLPSTGCPFVRSRGRYPPSAPRPGRRSTPC